ncbi:MAG: hypothetical protein AAGA92_13510 [Planctomycetota bacterium]
MSTVSASEPAEAETPGTLDETLAELRSMGEIDAAGEQQLRAELEGADPSLYPLIVRQFQAAVAYRKQLAERETERSDREPMLASRPKQTTASRLSNPPEATPEIQRSSPSSDSVPVGEPVRPESPGDRVPEQEATDAGSPQAQSERTRSLEDGHGVAVGNPMRAEDFGAVAFREDNAEPYGARKPAVGANLGRPQQEGITRPPVQPVSYAGNVGLPTEASTRVPAELLDEAIKQIESSLPAQPSSAGEVNSYLRVRLLQLAAGRESEAFRPIPGATPAQQDYWSSQLYALRTFLDDDAVPHAKQRSSATLTHLDDARDKLSDLATMQVHNLSIVESVGGYGDYVLDTREHYKPGDQVTLYAELINFRSESTEDGYQTSLGTSYEVLDDSGRRVDGGQFPDVDDRCENRRRDFHLQYSVPLPTRIYPGEYELRLVISDHLSHKIGQSSVRFRIAD